MDVYLLFEYVDSDLHKVIKANILEPIHEQYIAYQLFSAMKYIHSAQIIHRDIKPANIILNSECVIKLCDFGLSRSIVQLGGSSEEDRFALTDYVATRWYRAPEVLLGSTEYAASLDVWAVGCVVGELLAKKPIFPGSSTVDQLDRILKVSGRPSHEDVKAIKSQFAQTMIDSLRTQEMQGVAGILPNASPEACDLLTKCLHFNPLKRLTADVGVKHPYVMQFHSPDREPTCKRAVHIPIDDNERLTVEEYRNVLYSEVDKWKKKQRKVVPKVSETPEQKRGPDPQHTPDRARTPVKLSLLDMRGSRTEFFVPGLLTLTFMLLLMGAKTLRRYRKPVQGLQEPLVCML